MKKIKLDNIDIILLIAIIISLGLLFVRSIFAMSKIILIIALVVFVVKKLINLFQNKE